jgi:hypothetical protein
MTCKLLFQQFEPAIRKGFGRAIDDAGVAARGIRLEIHGDALRPGLKAEFAALPEEKIVRVTWNGIATLWACCQGFARLAKAMHDGVREGHQRLDITPGSDLQTGLNFVTASMWFRANNMPSDGKAHWINGLPPPQWSPATKTASAAIICSWERWREYSATRSLTLPWTTSLQLPATRLFKKSRQTT